MKSWKVIGLVVLVISFIFCCTSIGKAWKYTLTQGKLENLVVAVTSDTNIDYSSYGNVININKESVLSKETLKAISNINGKGSFSIWLEDSDGPYGIKIKFALCDIYQLHYSHNHGNSTLESWSETMNYKINDDWYLTKKSRPFTEALHIITGCRHHWF